MACEITRVSLLILNVSRGSDIVLWENKYSLFPLGTKILTEKSTNFHFRRFSLQNHNSPKFTISLSILKIRCIFWGISLSKHPSFSQDANKKHPNPKLKPNSHHQHPYHHRKGYHTYPKTDATAPAKTLSPPPAAAAH